MRLLPSLGFTFLVLGCGPDLFLMTEEHDRVGDGPWVYTGGSCSAIESGSRSGTGGGMEGSSYTLDITEDGAAFQLRENGEVIQEETYDRAFLESGEKARIAFDLAWRQHRVTLWGGPGCVEPKTPDGDEVEAVLTPPSAADAGVEDQER